jgi:dipeptidyl aminopeptidase/acylaminoacyl peptidase
MGFDPRKNPWQNWLRSPYYHVERIHTPLQIHQGKNDFRVPQWQTDLLVKKLKKLGREVEYYVYDDEGHGLMKFHNEEKAYERMVDFLDRHRQ